MRNGTRPKTVLTHATGQVQLEVPRDREGTSEPVIVKKRNAGVASTDGEGAKFWMSVLTGARNRGVKDTFFVVFDGLKGCRTGSATCGR